MLDRYRDSEVGVGRFGPVGIKMMTGRRRRFTVNPVWTRGKGGFACVDCSTSLDSKRNTIS